MHIKHGKTLAPKVHSSLADITACLRTLTEFYPLHIAKEDKVFFPAVRAYYTEAEDQAMLAEFYAFDRMMIHEKYGKMVKLLQEKQGIPPSRAKANHMRLMLVIEENPHNHMATAIMTAMI